MAEQQQARKKPRKKDHWDWFFGMTFGLAFQFIWWSLCTVFVAWVIEVIGMSYFWGAEHSREVLLAEMSYLGEFNRNLLTGLNPTEMAGLFGRWINNAVNFLHLHDIAKSLAKSGGNSMGDYVAHGIEILINTLFIFAVRLTICISAATGFVLVGVVAFIDGLVERDIRRACGGIESAMIYHRSKRLIAPLTMLSFGLYMTLPFSVHPTLVFLPIMTVVGYMIFMTVKSFKKYL